MMKLEEVAILAEVSRSTVYRVEYEDTAKGIDVILDIAIALDIDLEVVYKNFLNIS